MRDWLARHLNPPTVISVIALCAALGGGYAFAVSGSGSLERAKEDGISESPTYETVATLTGVGKIQAACASNGSPVLVRFKNTSGVALVSRAFAQNSDDYLSSGLADGATSFEFVVGVGAETIDWHVFPAGARSEPQATVSVSVTPSIAGSPSCEKADVAVLATTTEG